MTSRTNPLIQFLRGRLSWRDLPEEIILPESLWRQMDELWRRSPSTGSGHRIAHIAEGWVTECGGVLVLEGPDDLKLVNGVEGTERGIALRFTSGETFVGSFHTHPYPDGTTGIAFSGPNIADAINNGELISLVQSGSEAFALIRSVSISPARLWAFPSFQIASGIPSSGGPVA